MFSDIAIARAHWNGYLCVVDRIVDTKTTSISSFINDLVLLSLMVVGVLRWKLDRLTGGGIWQVMFKQVGISHPAVVTLIIQLDTGHRE
jgi:hypothetical protein